MNLADLFDTAQGGAALRNLASFYGLSPAQAQQAVDALLPAFSIGLKRQVEEPALIPGFAQMLGADQARAFFEAFASPDAAARQGQVFLDRIFGSREAEQRVASQAAFASGLGFDTVQKMLPAIASLVVGGIAKAAAEEGVKAYFDRFLTPFGAPPAAPAPPPSPAAIPNPWNTMAEAMQAGWMGGVPPAPAPAPRSDTDELAALGIAAMSRMLETGRDIQDRNMAAMQEILDAFLGHRPPGGR